MRHCSHVRFNSVKRVHGVTLSSLPVQAEKVTARMIAERRMNGTIDQIDGVVYFKSKLVGLAFRIVG